MVLLKSFLVFFKRQSFVSLKLIRVVFWIVVLFLALTGNRELFSFSSVVVTDLRGKKVTINSRSGRYVVLFPQTLPFFYIIHAQNGLVGYPGFGVKKNPYFSQGLILKVDPYLRQRCIDVGYPGMPNIETIVSLKPDFVVNMYAMKKTNHMLEKMGIPVIGLTGFFGTLSDFLKNIEILGRATFHYIDALKFINFYKEKIIFVKSETCDLKKKLRVLYLSYQGPFGKRLTAGGKFNTLTHDIIEIAGGIDVAGDVSHKSLFGQISVEDVLRWNPDVIIVGCKNGKRKILSNKKIRFINAVRYKKIYEVPMDGDTNSSTWYSPEKSVLGLLWTAKILYPSRFNNFSLFREAEYYYKTFWGVDIKELNIRGDVPWKAN